MGKKLNLKEQIHRRIIPILKMKDFNDEEQRIALTSVYDDFEKQGYERHVISTLISVCIIEEMTRCHDELNQLIKELGK